jgi:hypothetical protein
VTGSIWNLESHWFSSNIHDPSYAAKILIYWYVDLRSTVRVKRDRDWKISMDGSKKGDVQADKRMRLES